METYWEARLRGERQGFVPVLVRCDDLLLEGMLEQSDPDSDGEEFSARAVEEYRRNLLSMPVESAAALVSEDREMLAIGEEDEAAMDEGGRSKALPPTGTNAPDALTISCWRRSR